MKKLFILGLLALTTSFCSQAQLSPLAGPFSGCVGQTTYVYDVDSTATGGTWSSSNTAIASVTATGFGVYGAVTGISAGVAIITYSLSGSSVTESFTVNPTPLAITGPATACVGATIALSDATGGGTWSSSSGVGTVNSATGVVTGVSGGSTTIYYTLPTGCAASAPVTISGLASYPISGPSSTCAGSTIALSDTTSGGVWSSSSTGIATVSSGGVVYGVSAGTVTISYSLTTSCGTSSATRTITVSSSSGPAAIAGPSTVATGSSITLTDATFGGTWSSSDPAIVSVNEYTGVVTGLAPGTATITYIGGPCSGAPGATTVITVTATDGIFGHVNFTGTGYSGNVKVWLITYDPATSLLEAIDSSIIPCSSTSVFYEFTGLSTDSFRVKADAIDDSATTTGFVPTYHTSSYYWHDATVIYHVSGTADVNKDINMATGTVTAGPGFVGGNVTSGANRGTSTGAPVAGLLVLLQNTTTGAIVQQTYTDASGNYSFSTLSYGTYFVYPELINYATTPYTSITISAATPSVSNASFIQHTISKTITPVNEAVNNTPAATASVIAFPNPASSKLTLLWNTPVSETGNVSITDMAGREVYKAAITMSVGSGINQVDLSGMTSGLYLISVKSAHISYNNKIVVQH